MKKNMGICDRLIRLLVVAPVATVVGVTVGPTSVASWILYAVAAIMVATGVTGFCLLYSLFGTSTRAAVLHERTES